MRIRIDYIGHIRNIIRSGREEEVEIEDKASIADLLMMLSERYGEPFKKAVYEKSGTDVKSNYIITVNGYLLNQLDGIKTKLKPGDNVTILPIVSGG